ncbi:hypothetical protein SUGI_0030440 [Cryptomeria japonica]|nr:hypothetical protein SUGI_0030440 [Cryptomeria japonica]
MMAESFLDTTDRMGYVERHSEFFTGSHKRECTINEDSQTLEFSFMKIFRANLSTSDFYGGEEDGWKEASENLYRESDALDTMAFESWLVAEHFKRGFDPQWLLLRLSKAIFLDNGLVAIMSRLFANTLAETLGFGPISPFDVVACFLAIGKLLGIC